MSVTPGEASAVALLAAIGDPAVIVDDAGLVVAWNGAAAAFLGIGEDPWDRSLGAMTGRRADSAERIALADPPGATLLAWHLDEKGLVPNDIALEKLDLIGRIAGGVRHDLMNPLGAVMGFAELQAEDQRMPADLRESAEPVREAAQRVRQMIETMLEFSRATPPDPKPLALGPLVRGMMRLLGHATTDMQPRVTDVQQRVVMPEELPPVEADRGQLEQALLAIVVNALEAQGATWTKGAPPVPGRLTVSGRALDDARGSRVRLVIEDGGPVVPLEARSTLFSGSGVGRASRDLAVARVLLERAGGRLTYEPVGGGNRMVVELPVMGATLTESSEAEHSPALVLVCDAMQLIRTLLVRFTERVGTEVEAVEARDGREALAILAQQPVALVIADVSVEGGGTELYDQAVALRPELARRFILLSADPGNARLVEFTRRTGVPVIPKPFDNVRLEQLVRDAIEG